MYGQHCIKTWSSTQAIISMSSGEAEYYGIVKGASVGLGLRSMLADINTNVDIEVFTDATAAKGVASRRGLGGTRHIEVHYLWVQEKVANKDIRLGKVWGRENPADLLTKHLDAQTMNRYMSMLGLEMLEGRSAAAPSLNGLRVSRDTQRFTPRLVPAAARTKTHKHNGTTRASISACGLGKGECGKLNLYDA